MRSVFIFDDKKIQQKNLINNNIKRIDSNIVEKSNKLNKKLSNELFNNFDILQPEVFNKYHLEINSNQILVKLHKTLFNEIKQDIILGRNPGLFNDSLDSSTKKFFLKTLKITNESLLVKIGEIIDFIYLEYSLENNDGLLKERCKKLIAIINTYGENLNKNSLELTEKMKESKNLGNNILYDLNSTGITISEGEKKGQRKRLLQLSVREIASEHFNMHYLINELSEFLNFKFNETTIKSLEKIIYLIRKDFISKQLEINNIKNKNISPNEAYIIANQINKNSYSILAKRVDKILSLLMIIK